MTRYEEGFLTKCAEYGLDADQSVVLLKVAVSTKPLVAATRRAAVGIAKKAPRNAGAARIVADGLAKKAPVKKLSSLLPKPGSLGYAFDSYFRANPGEYGRWLNIMRPKGTFRTKPPTGGERKALIDLLTNTWIPGMRRVNKKYPQLLSRLDDLASQAKQGILPR